jgi:ketosteroid isomerase-like protein
MRIRQFISVTLIFLGLGATVTTALGQTWSDKQLEVWSVIETQWKAAMEKDDNWTDKYLHDNFLGWGNQNPTPRGKASVKKWNRYGTENSTTLLQELFPVGIVVNGNTAVAHYFYSQASEDRKGERKTVNGQYTDILVKENGAWRFLAWRGGDNPTSN